MTETGLVPYQLPRSLAALSAEAPGVFLPNKRAAERFVDFFTSNIRNRHTRRAYYKAACRFSACAPARACASWPRSSRCMWPPTSRPCWLIIPSQP